MLEHLSRFDVASRAYAGCTQAYYYTSRGFFFGTLPLTFSLQRCRLRVGVCLVVTFTRLCTWVVYVLLMTLS